jgi:hypothetical protein
MREQMGRGAEIRPGGQVDQGDQIGPGERGSLGIAGPGGLDVRGTEYRGLVFRRTLVRLIALGCLTLSAAACGVMACGPMAHGMEPLEPRADSADQLLPDTTLAYLEIARPAEFWDRVATHRGVTNLLASDAYLEATRSPALLPLMAGLATFGFAMGQPWDTAVKEMLADGVTLAVDGKTGGILVLIRPGDEEHLGRFRRVIGKLIRDDAARKGEPDPVKSGEYRQHPALRVGPWTMVTFSGWLLFTNNEEAGKQLVNRHLDQTGGSLADDARYAQSRSQRPVDSDIWGYLDFNRLRDLVERQQGSPHPLLDGRAPDPGAELLLGGLLTILQHADQGTATVRVGSESVRLEVSLPHARKNVPEEREYFFRDFDSDLGQRSPLPRAALPQTVASLSLYRDFSRMWLYAGDLFSEEVNNQLAAADGTLTTLFSGKDFGEEILGAMQPRWQLLVVRRTWEDDEPSELPPPPRPAIRLPAFALIAELRDPESMGRDLRRVFMNLVGFLNIVGAMNGQPQLDLTMESHEEGERVTASYDPPDATATGELPVQYNFSPSLSLRGRHAILASHSALDLDVESALRQRESVADDEPQERSNRHLALEVHTGELAEVLQDNLRQLVAQNILEKGHRREEAEREVGGLIGLLRLLSQIEVHLDIDQQARLTVEVKVP